MTRLATEHQVSRKFLYQQKERAAAALSQTFVPSNKENESEVLFYLPVTYAWLQQLILGLVLICYSSYRGVVELLRDLFDWSISVGTVHNRVRSATEDATTLNAAEDLSGIRVGLHDEIFQGGMPVLAGVCAFSTYCYLLVSAEHRDKVTWGYHLLEAQERGFCPERTIADDGQGLRAGQKLAMPGVPCDGDVFHILQDCKNLSRHLKRKAQAAGTRVRKLEEKIAKAQAKGKSHPDAHLLEPARQEEQEAIALATDVQTLVDWLHHDVFELAGPEYAVRRELLEFIIAELQWREERSARIATVRRALDNQGEQLLGFARRLDEKLAAIAQKVDVPLYWVRQVCLLQRKSAEGNAYWQRWNELHHQLGHKFHPVAEAVAAALEETPRSSSLVENLNSRLRSYFSLVRSSIGEYSPIEHRFLRRQLGGDYLELLRFFLNHRRFLRSRRPERVGKSPAELMTGKEHPHWLELLGFERFRRCPAYTKDLTTKSLFLPLKRWLYFCCTVTQNWPILKHPKKSSTANPCGNKGCSLS